MAINIGSNTIKGINVGSTVIARAFLGTQKIYDQLDYPTLDLNFAATKTLDPRITFTRASSGSYFDANGNIQIASTNTPRFDHNPVTGESLGLLIEEQRTNLLLNSATLSTQSVTVTNTAHTLSFYGSGTIVLSGVHSATVNGLGAFPTRTTLTFTPTAGTLTLTVSGDVQYAQLGAGIFATSWIPTTGVSTTRAGDSVVLTGTNFSDWYRQDEGCFFCSGKTFAASDYGPILVCQLAGGSSRFSISPASNSIQVVNNGVSQVSMGIVQQPSNFKGCFAYKTNDFAVSINGATPEIDVLGTTSTNLTYARIGRFDFGAGRYLNGTIQRIAYFNRRLANLELQLLST